MFKCRTMTSNYEVTSWFLCGSHFNETFQFDITDRCNSSANISHNHDPGIMIINLIVMDHPFTA